MAMPFCFGLVKGHPVLPPSAALQPDPSSKETPRITSSPPYLSYLDPPCPPLCVSFLSLSCGNSLSGERKSPVR